MISISRVFCLWVVFFLGSILSYGVSEARHHRPSAVVVGTVFCHTCFRQSFSDANRFISGAVVAVECGGEGRQSFRSEVKTDGRGEFKVNLPFSVARGVKKIRGCSVEVISSGEPSCAVASAAAATSSIRFKEMKEGSLVFSAGVFTFRPLKQPEELCNQKTEKLPQILDPPASILPPIPGVPGVPQLPVPPLGPGIPLVPPVSNLPVTPIPVIPPIGPGIIPLIPPAAPRKVKEQQVVEPSIFPPFGILPPNPLLPPPSLLPPNPFFPPPSIIPPVIPSPPPSIFPPLFPSPPPSIFPPILPSPPSPPPSIFPPLFPSPPSPPPSIFPPLFPRPIFPPIPGLTPSPPPPPPPSPFFPFPLPPFPFQPSPGTPPPEFISSAQKNP